MLYGDISLPMRRLDFGCSYCPLPLLAGAGGEVRGGEVGELDWRCAVCILWGKGAGGIFRACMLCLGNVVHYRSLLELVGR